jgi:hypothetical protein
VRVERELELVGQDSLAEIFSKDGESLSFGVTELDILRNILESLHNEHLVTQLDPMVATVANIDLHKSKRSRRPEDQREEHEGKQEGGDEGEEE